MSRAKDPILCPRVVGTCLLVLILMFAAAACADEQPAAEPENPDLVFYDVQIDADTASMGEEKRKLLERLNRGEKISFNAVTNLMVWDHEDAYAEERFDGTYDAATAEQIREQLIEARTRLAAIIPNNLLTLSPGEVKAEYESALSDYFGGKDLIYNRDKTNLMHALLEQRMQCYSGTTMYEVVSRQMGAEEFRKRDRVVIFTKGHILPGYVRDMGDGPELFGIETTRTATGGPVRYGLLRDLGGQIVVIDAELFALTDIFRGRIRNACELRNRVVRLTAERFGIAQPRGFCDPEDANRSDAIAFVDSANAKNPSMPLVPVGSEGSRNFADNRGVVRELGASIFAFGTPDVMPGDSSRLDGEREIDKRDRYERPEVTRAPAPGLTADAGLAVLLMKIAELERDARRRQQPLGRVDEPAAAIAEPDVDFDAQRRFFAGPEEQPLAGEPEYGPPAAAEPDADQDDLSGELGAEEEEAARLHAEEFSSAAGTADEAEEPARLQGHYGVQEPRWALQVTPGAFTGQYLNPELINNRRYVDLGENCELSWSDEHHLIVTRYLQQRFTTTSVGTRGFPIWFKVEQVTQPYASELTGEPAGKPQVVLSGHAEKAPLEIRCNVADPKDLPPQLRRAY